MVNLSLVLPVHNEALIIQGVLDSIMSTLRKTVGSFECILVENGSTDNTLEVLENLAKKYRQVRVLVAPKGYGSAVLAGLRKASGLYVCYMPSDGQIDLSIFSSLWKATQTTTWDMVKVRRVSRETWKRTVVSNIFSLAVSVLFDIPRLDVNGSPRIFHRRNRKLLALASQDSFIDVEFAVKAHLLGWKILELPMRTLPRSGGTSTRSWRTYWEFCRNLYRFRLYTYPQLKKKLKTH